MAEIEMLRDPEMQASGATAFGAASLKSLSSQTFNEVLEELVLDEEDCAWYLESGQVDVYIVEHDEGKVVSSYKHLTRAKQGSLVLGVRPDRAPSLSLRLKGTTGFRAHKIPLAKLAKAIPFGTLAALVDEWIEAFSESIAREVPLLPRVDANVQSYKPVDLNENTVVSSQRGVVWASTNQVASFLSTGDTGADMPEFLPVCPSTWLTYRQAAQIRTLSSLELLEQGTLWDQLAAFHETAMAAEKLNRQVALVDIANLQVDTSKLRDAQEDEARAQLARIAQLDRETGTAQEPTLMRTLRIIGDKEKIDFVEPRGDAPRSLGNILIASGVRGRQVRLAAETNWWTGDSFSLLAFRREDNRPVALITSALGRYRLVDPASNTSSRLSVALARQLSEKAWMFYRPLPKGQATRRDLFSLAGQGLHVELLRFTVSGLLVGLCAFFPALAFGLFADWVLPTQSGALVWTLTLALVLVAFFGTIMTFLHGSTILRAEARMATRLSASIWDRIIGMRPSRLHGFSAGELTSRAMVFQTMRERASNFVTGSITSVTFLFPTLLLLFIYDRFLGMVVLAVGLVSMCALVALGLAQFSPQTRYFQERQGLSGTLFQFINGIGKLRTAGAEQSAFALWVRGFVRQKQAEIKLNRVNEVIVATTSSIPLIASAVVFIATLSIRSENLSLGDFIVVYAVSMMFFSATTRLAASIQALASVSPEFERVMPLLERAPETQDGPAHAENTERTLRGELRFDHVSFAYPGSKKLILDDVSIHIHAGEFVALVGASGAGKSTLLNLALGLEQPTAGAIYYDNYDVANMNRRSLRRQLGVVTQDAALQPGTLLQNITGVARDLTEKQAWKAASTAGVEVDIRRMHLGLHTPVGENSAYFSGGQVQRILIAAALIREPRILFLDEATNWLDNTSQQEVMDNLSTLAMTRVVIAHRLSAIRQADRIYVLDESKVVQCGTFDELSNQPGVFRELISRQR